MKYITFIAKFLFDSICSFEKIWLVVQGICFFGQKLLQFQSLSSVTKTINNIQILKSIPFQIEINKNYIDTLGFSGVVDRFQN